MSDPVFAPRKVGSQRFEGHVASSNDASSFAAGMPTAQSIDAAFRVVGNAINLPLDAYIAAPSPFGVLKEVRALPAMWAGMSVDLVAPKDPRVVAQSRVRWRSGPDLPSNVLHVPIHRQEADYSCGPAALLSVMRYWRAFDGAERDLYDLLETTPRDGTEPVKIAETAAAFGLTVEMRTGMTTDDLRAQLARGKTVILDIQAWRTGSSARMPWEDVWEDGHYAVLIGMDAKYAYFMDPVLSDTYAYMPLDELPRRWHDYENRHGTTQRYFGLGIIMSGKPHPPGAPLPTKKPARLD
jgi:predicted double-glycine peptidase